MSPLVSIIIPCYNAEKWIGEAIDSALAQIYSPIEVIVIDDGSTDGSLDVIKSYGSKIKWETGVNRGQSAARNKGFMLSQGKYIQWLDGDDYILPEKIENQVAYLEKTGTDIVYGDWRYQYHRKNGEIELGEIYTNRQYEDVLAHILLNNYLTIMICLTRREAIEKINGFDENLRAAEDTDLWIRLAISGAKFEYLSGYYSFYRICDGVRSVSHDPTTRFQDSCSILLEKTYKLLESENILNDRYRKMLAIRHFFHAKGYLFSNNFSSFKKHMQLVRHMDSKFIPDGSSNYERTFRLFGEVVTGYLFLIKISISNYIR